MGLHCNWEHPLSLLEGVCVCVCPSRVTVRMSEDKGSESEGTQWRPCYLPGTCFNPAKLSAKTSKEQMRGDRQVSVLCLSPDLFSLTSKGCCLKQRSGV